jgi:transposase
MLRLEGYVEIQVLKRQGKSMRAISAELGMSRNTVRKYLRSKAKPRANARPPRATKLDPYRSYVEGRVRQAHPHWYQQPHAMRQILESGAAGPAVLGVKWGS